MKRKISDLGSIEGISQEMVEKIQELKEEFKEGRYEFKGGAYANAESYTTQPAEKRLFEAHREYIDVQIIVSGQETIEVADVNAPEFAVVKPYEPDIVFMNGSVTASKVTLRAGEFCVLYPKDAHKPCCHFDGPHEVQKVVIKLPVKQDR